MTTTYQYLNNVTATILDSDTGKRIPARNVPPAIKETAGTDMQLYKELGSLLLAVTKGNGEARELVWERLQGNEAAYERLAQCCADNPAFRRHPDIKEMLRSADNTAAQQFMHLVGTRNVLAKPEPAAPPQPTTRPRVLNADELPANLQVVYTEDMLFCWRHTVSVTVVSQKGERQYFNVLPNWGADLVEHPKTLSKYETKYNADYHRMLRNAPAHSAIGRHLRTFAQAVNEDKIVIVLAHPQVQMGHIVATEIMRWAKILKHLATQPKKVRQAQVAGPSYMAGTGYEDMDDIRAQDAAENPPLTSGRHIYDYQTLRDLQLGHGISGPLARRKGELVPAANSSEDALYSDITVDRRRVYTTRKGNLGYQVAEYDDYVRLLLVSLSGEKLVVDDYPQTMLRRNYVPQQFEKEHVDPRTGEVFAEKIRYLPKLSEELQAHIAGMLQRYYKALAEERRRFQHTTLTRPLVGSQSAAQYEENARFVDSRYHGYTTSSRFDSHTLSILTPSGYDAIQSAFYAATDGDECALDWVLKGEMDVKTAGMLSHSAGADVIIAKQTVIDDQGHRKSIQVAKKAGEARFSAKEVEAVYEKMLKAAKQQQQERMLFVMEARRAIVTTLIRSGMPVAEIESRFCPNIRPMRIIFPDGKQSVLAPLAQYTNITPVLVYDQHPLTVDEMKARNGGRYIADVAAIFAPRPMLAQHTPEGMLPRLTDRQWAMPTDAQLAA